MKPSKSITRVGRIVLMILAMNGLALAQQWGGSSTQSGNIYRTGNVGIGVTNPGFMLDVDDRIRLRQGATNAAGLWLFQSNSDRAFIGMADDNHVGFYGQTGAGWKMVMNTTTGSVGIGTTNPVSGSVLTLNAVEPRVHLQASGTSRAFLNYNDNAGLDIGTWSGAVPDIAFQTAGTRKMIIDGEGNVGIGAFGPTNRPLSRLHIKGNSPVRILGDLNTLSGSEYVDFMARNSQWNSEIGGMRIQRDAAGNVNTLLFAAAAGNGMSEKMRIGGNGNVLLGTSGTETSYISRAGSIGALGLTGGSGSIILYGNNHASFPAEIRFQHPDPLNPFVPYERMVIKGNGDVGIGTPNPQSKLAVNGRITAKEVVVTLGGWSDFVFDENYQLPSLEEVERHIKEKKHLPDIPSEQEVLAGGVSLGDMQAKLLQKIEELTLYVIELKKENQRLQLQFTTLEKDSK